MIALCTLAIFYLPIDVLRGTPASGGDTGSHFWPLHALINFALPNRIFPVLNPGNNLGEPQLLHYFATPFFIMALLVPFVGEVGRAFNIGTILPIVVFPGCVYLFFVLSRIPRRIGVAAAAFSLFSLYNEAFSMWGGNTLSLLAGQFAHQYSLCFFVVAAGQFNRELVDRRAHVWSSILFALTITSHAYVGLIIPFYVGIRGLLELELPIRQRLWRAIYCTTLSLLMSAWSIVPMVQNNKWTTPLPMIWVFSDWMNQLLPEMLYPIGGGIAVASVALILFRKLLRNIQPASRALLSLLAITLIYGGLYFAMPKLGLVDVRVIPQISLFLAMISGALVGTLTLALPAGLSALAMFAVCGLSVYWTNLHVDRFPMWSKWNYTGWYAKDVYPLLAKMYDKLHGDFSQPRVAWEHATINDRGGSLRVFEMLPYFTGRGTLESLYTQSTIAAPMVYYLQSLISQHPSCPFRQYRCGRFNLTDAEDKLRLLGASELILSDPKSIEAAARNPYLKLIARYDPWVLYGIENVSLVEVPRTKFFFLGAEEWKQQFYDWFTNYSRGTPFIIALPDDNSVQVENLRTELNKQSSLETQCNPSLKVDFNRLELTTPCPGQFHILKFAFHPNWIADTGERLLNTSPGVIGVIPKGEKLVLRFRPSRDWKVASLVSLLTLLGLLVVAFWGFFFRKKKP